MPFLTVTASQEEQVNSFSRFLKSLTWEKVLPAAVILAVSLVLIKILTTLFGKAIARSKLDETLRPLARSVFRVLLYTMALLVVAGHPGC